MEIMDFASGRVQETLDACQVYPAGFWFILRPLLRPLLRP